MWKKLTNVHMDVDKPNEVVESNGVMNSIGNLRISQGAVVSMNYDVKECTQENSIIQNGIDDQDPSGVKSTNFGTDIADEENEETGDRKFTDNKKLSTAVTSKYDRAEDIRVHQSLKAGSNGIASVNSTPSPTATKTLERISPWTPPMSRKLFQPFDRRHLDEEDNWSVASTTAASFRSARSRVTIGTAPTFRSSIRAERRKEFYQKLEEKHQALEAERNQCEARTKEEQEAALKQLRKNMVVKANPVPNFYYKGPRPKVELKKLPLTRPKSPNLSRRKSCNDAVRPSLEEKAKTCYRTHRHSLGTHTERSVAANEIKSKGQVGGTSSNGAGKVKDRAKPATEKAPRKITKQSDANITVES